MKKVLTYLGLHFKLQFRKDTKQDLKSKILTTIMALLTFAVVLFLLKYLFDIIKLQFISDISPKQFSVLVFSIIGIVLTIVGVVLEIKFFLKPFDLQITARYPMTSLQIFVSQLLIVYIYLLIVSVMCIFPSMLILGWSFGILSGAFVGSLILATLFAPIIPFALATMFVVPTMYILVLLENKNILKLIIFIILLTACFVLYSFLLNFLADYYVHRNLDVGTKGSILSFISSMNIWWNVFAYANNLAFGVDIFKSILIIFGIFVVLMSIGICASMPIYKRVRENVLDGNISIFSKKSKLTSDAPFVAIFKKDFKEIIRTHTYAYFYLGIAIITPVMVFMTNKLIQKVGEAQMGGSIAFGVSVLVVLAFMCMINSFSAIAISREGKQFYITKIAPVDYRTQLLAKGLINVLVSVIALVMSVVILCSMEFVTVVQGVVIFAVATLMSFGIIFNGFNLNAKFSNLATDSNGVVNQSNLTITLLLGFFLCAILGVIAMVGSFFIDFALIYWIILGFALIYALINVLFFVFNVNKKYARIE